MLIKALFIALLCGVCALAMWKGHGEERWTAAAILLASLASALVPMNAFASPEFGVMSVDVALLVFLVVVALRSDRFWPLWAAGFQVVGTTIHAATLVQADVLPRVYAAAQGFWAYPVMAALIAGTWLEARYRDS